MKIITVFALGVIGGATLLSSCASQNGTERSAARQRNTPPETIIQASSQSETTSSAEQSPRVVMAAAPAQDAAKAGDATKGKEAFEQCAICHNVDSDEEKMGPSLKGIFKKKALKNKKEASEQNVRQIVKEGGNGMPGYEEVLSAEEMDNLIAYLKTV